MAFRNEFGNLLRLTTWGESHGEALGGVIDGFPAGVTIDFTRLNEVVARRRPGYSGTSTSRREPDEVEFLSGIYDGRTLGTPIAFVVRNRDTRSADYEELRDKYRPNHADFTYQAKYGIRDHRGGGRSSGRETVARVVAGALAMQVLESLGITVNAYAARIGNVAISKHYSALDFSKTYTNDVRCPQESVASIMENEIKRVGREGDTLGGIVSCVIGGVPAGLGEPVFGKLQAQLAAAMMSIGAAKGFSYGAGFHSAEMRGSELIDEFVAKDGRIGTVTNHSGGIQGGISNGEDIYFSVGFKPVPTLSREVNTVDVSGNRVTINAGGRHDVCVVPRAVPVVEAMAALVILDNLLINRAVRL